MLQEQVSNSDTDADLLKAGQGERPPPWRESPAPHPLATGEGSSQRQDKQTYHMVTPQHIVRAEGLLRHGTES